MIALWSQQYHWCLPRLRLQALHGNKYISCGAAVERVTVEAVHEAIENVCGSSAQTALIQVISAFDVPNIAYEPIRKAFYHKRGPRSLLGTAQVRTHAHVA
jgi:hypothetical protein